MKKPSVKRIIGASVIAALLGLIQPTLFMTAMLVCVTPVCIAALYAWAGWIPVAVASALTVGSLGWFASVSGGMSPVLAALSALVVFVAPALAGIAALEKRLPFFKRMAVTVGAQTAALIGFACLVYLGLKVDLVDAMVGMLRSSIEMMPADALGGYLNVFAMYGILNEESMKELNEGILLWSDVRKVLDQAFDLITYQFRQTMPAMLINSGLVSGMLITAVPSRICMRRGDEPDVGHVPMTGWFLPSRAVAGIAVCMGTGLVLQYMKVEGSGAVMAVFTMLYSTLCITQGIAALNRKFRDSGASKGARVGLTVAALLFAMNFLEIVGAMSALFGRKGAISSWMRKRIEENRKDDDEE